MYFHTDIEGVMAEQERTPRADPSETIGDNRQDPNDAADSQSQSASRSSNDGPTDASNRNQRSTADDLDESFRARGGEGYGEVY
jgi:hypothetical protein